MIKRKLFAPSEEEGGGKKILFNHEQGLDNKEGDQYEYPYETVHDDHCETPLKAYQDIQQAVKLLADGLGKTVAELKIYDPYYCEGNVIKRLNFLGFANVYNKKEDFYKMQELGSLPDYDILVTNPPYSSDHVEKLFAFVAKSSKPWLLLLPNYCYMKDYFAIVQKSCRPFFIAPAKGLRYLYTTPKGRRQAKSAKYTSPFPSFWYCCFKSHQNEVLGALNTFIVSNRNSSSNSSSSDGGGGSSSQQAEPITYTLARRVEDIPIEVSPDSDPRKKKLRNSQKRKKHKKRQKDKQTHEST